MTIEVCDICNHQLTGEDYENDFKLKVKLVQKIQSWDSCYKKKFRLCNHCKMAIALTIKEYSDFMRSNENSNLVPKIYIEEQPIQEINNLIESED